MVISCKKFLEMVISCKKCKKEKSHVAIISGFGYGSVINLTIQRRRKDESEERCTKPMDMNGPFTYLFYYFQCTIINGSKKILRFTT